MHDTSSTATAAETTFQRSRRRRRFGERSARASVPYGLIIPVAVVIALVLGYPLYWLGKLSTEKYGLFELIQHHGTSVGFANYSSVLHDSVFWHTLLRTIVFTAVNVSLTMGIGLLIALLLVRVSTWVRLVLSSGLVLVWSMPVVVAVQVFYWMTNFQNGVVNYVLTKLGVGDFSQHGLVRIDVLAAQPGHGADRVGGAAVRRDHALRRARAGSAPTSSKPPRSTVRGPSACSGTSHSRSSRPILLILTSLSIIWDFGVFTSRTR